MQLMADGIHDFTVADHQKNPSEELIVSWIAIASSDISEEMIESSFFECIEIKIFLRLLCITTSSVFLTITSLVCF